MERRSRGQRKRRRHITVTMLSVLFGLIALALLGIGIAALLPPPEAGLAQATHIYDHNGTLVTQLFEQRRTPVSLSALPPHVVNAVIAIEDERFYDHFGLDVIALVRAAARNYAAGRIVEGGSTITQQLAKNLFLSPERTYARKVRELVLTLQLEQALTKREILEQYLNTIYFGHGAYGIEEASRTYFGISAHELELHQSALIAGLIRAPERSSPHRDLDRAVARQHTVLDRMVTLGYISEAQAARARAQQLAITDPPEPYRQAAYFVQMVIDELSELLPDAVSGLYRGGLRITTTLDYSYQQAAEAAVAGLPVLNIDNIGVTQPQSAIVALDVATGGIRALVGGRDFRQTQFNRAVQARRQPGSAFKPFVYIAALDQGFRATASRMCEPVTFPGGAVGDYTPTDHGAKPYHYRPLGMREALAISDNVVAVRWLHELRVETVIRYAKTLGIDSPLEPNLSLALGTSEVTPMEMARAYATIANGGIRSEPFTILSVETADGEILYERQKRAVRVLRPEVAYIMTDLLRSVVRRGGTGAAVAAGLEHPLAAKTGTTEGLNDAWFVGYTAEVHSAVWVGNDRPEQLPGTGASIAGPVWRSFMQQVLAGTAPRDFATPAGIRHLAICSESGLLAGPSCFKVEHEVFASPLLPLITCSLKHDLPPLPGDSLLEDVDDDPDDRDLFERLLDDTADDDEESLPDAEEEEEEDIDSFSS